MTTLPIHSSNSTKRVWDMVKGWIGLPSIRTNEWPPGLSIKEWWSTMTFNAAANRKEMASLVMLVSWIIWKERNARIFNNKSTPPSIILEIIKGEARLWVSAGAKLLSNIIPGE